MLIGSEEYRMGNVNDENVFQQKIFWDISNKFKTHVKSKIKKCENCYLNNICNSCMGINNILNKSAFEPSDTHCKLNKKIFNKILFNLAEKYTNV